MIWSIRKYQKYLSPIKTTRCPYYPYSAAIRFRTEDMIRYLDSIYLFMREDE